MQMPPDMHAKVQGMIDTIMAEADKERSAALANAMIEAMVGHNNADGTAALAAVVATMVADLPDHRVAVWGSALLTMAVRLRDPVLHARGVAGHA